LADTEPTPAVISVSGKVFRDDINFILSVVIENLDLRWSNMT
jgi:hypothetical protein